ncbi:MAG: outer membrane beta-barrel protein [Helicobacteraceae bacterium]|nr:outer membrane beta-barrel protein [Helicobacteraceae bacterium]
MKKLLVVILVVFFANAALAAESRLKSSGSAGVSAENSSVVNSSEGWQINAGIHMSKFKVSAGDTSDSKNNTPFSLAIAKEISTSNSGGVLFELSLMTGEKYEDSEEYSDGSAGVKAEIEMKMQMALFASLYYQFNTAVTGLKPYIGAGLGLASLKLSLSGSWDEYDPLFGSDSGSVSISETANSFAYQLGLGANYFFSKNIAAGLGWGYRDYGSLDWYGEKVKMKSSGLFGKLTYRF